MSEDSLLLIASGMFFIMHGGGGGGLIVSNKACTSRWLGLVLPASRKLTTFLFASMRVYGDAQIVIGEPFADFFFNVFHFLWGLIENC